MVISKYPIDKKYPMLRMCEEFSMRYIAKITSKLTQSDITGILTVLNGTFNYWGNRDTFYWKYCENPFG